MTCRPVAASLCEAPGLGRGDIFSRVARRATIAAKDDWQITHIRGVITGDQFEAIQHSELAPFNPAEPALIARPSPGAYTAIVHGANNTSGVGVIAIYILP